MQFHFPFNLLILFHFNVFYFILYVQVRCVSSVIPPVGLAQGRKKPSASPVKKVTPAHIRNPIHSEINHDK